MSTPRKLISIGLAALLVLLVGVLAAIRQANYASRAAAILATVEEVRITALRHVLYLDDLVRSRQTGDKVTERESFRLATESLDDITSGLRALERGDKGRGVPAVTGPAAQSDLRHSLDLWSHHRGSSEDVLRGRAVSINLESVRRNAMQLVVHLNNLAGAARRQHDSHSLWLKYVLAGTVLLELLLGLLLFWVLRREVFLQLTKILEYMQLLSSGALSPATVLPDSGRGDIGRLTYFVNRFLERYREAGRTKDQFLAAMSHEIRTPMNGVIGFLGNLRETPLNEQQRQYVRVIESSARNLLKVINGILDFSKLNAGSMELEAVAFDLEQLLDDLRAMTKQLVNGKSVKVTVETHGLEEWIIRGDPTRLRQVLDNLLGNAAKFTDHGEIRVDVTGTPAEGDRVNLAFAVRDTGIGISPDRQKALFEPFQQGETGTTRKYGGTGLGLCIASSLVRLMGDELTVSSRIGEGSVFSFKLTAPTARPEEQVQLSGHYRISLPPGALRKFWALLVDDSPTNLFLMETICQNIGLPYRTATNGKEAVELAERQAFDLIFMDIQMPVMDGYTAIRQIRQLPNSGVTQIVALTASAFQEDVDQALGSGSTGFLAKPFERDQLLLCIAQHLDIPVTRELREPLVVQDADEDILIRQMYDFMREQYDISLGEIKMILVQSVSDWRPLLDDLRVFAKRQDWENVRGITHRLKGQLASIGLTYFAEQAAAVTADIRADDTAKLTERIETFIDELGAAFRAVERDVTLDTHPSS